MIQLTLPQAFVTEFLIVLEVILTYRLVSSSPISQNLLFDIVATLVIITIPYMTISSFDLVFIVCYIWLNDRLRSDSYIIANNILAISTGIVMLSLYDFINHIIYLLFLQHTKELSLLGWLIPTGDFIATILIGIIVVTFLRKKCLWFKLHLMKPIQIWKITMLMFILYIALTAIAERDKITNTYFSLIFVMYFTIIISGGISLFNFIKNYQQKQHQQSLIENYQNQVYYSKKINQQFDNLRRERHDTKNLLISVQGYIKNGEDEKAVKMLSSFLNTEVSDKHYLDVDNALSKLQISGLRNLIKEKAYQIVEQKIPLAIEISNSISYLPGSEISTARIVGILLDNAIEATAKQQKPYIQIALLQHNKNLYELIVANSLENTVNINKVMKLGNSTKRDHEGIGLSNIMDIVDHDQHYLFSAEVKNKSIIMTCFIQGKSE